MKEDCQHPIDKRIFQTTGGFYIEAGAVTDDVKVTEICLVCGDEIEDEKEEIVY